MGGSLRPPPASVCAGAAKPQTAKLGSLGARPSPDPLPPSLRPHPPRPQAPAGAFLTFPSSSGPAGEDSIRRVANPHERLASPAAEPGARPEVGGAPPAAAAPGPLWASPGRPLERTRRRTQAPSRSPAPAGAPRAPGGSGCPRCGRCWRAGPRRARTQRGRLCSRLAGSALAPPGPPPTPRPPPPPAPAAPSPAAAAAAPLLSPARLFSPFFPFLAGGWGASQAEPGAGRRGEEEEEAEDEEKEEERGESCFPPPGCRRSPISRSLKLDPESGARDCITDYIRLYRASRSHIRGGALAGGGGVGGGERDKGGRIKCTHARTPRRARCLPRSAEKPRVGFLLSAFSRSRGVAPLAGWMMDGGRQDGHTDEWREGSEGLCLGNAGPLDRYPEGAFPEGRTLEK
nr:translation initiation factor IF-2-like [Gorilla gorilla gorilla]